ncbi:MAG TPA: MarR family transcriptional regulator [Verrucomicrobiota bacterium]|nr:MarR family transcriptional regulator [Verrucomicrobiota bacterium]
MPASPSPRPGYRALLQLLRTADTVWNASRDFFARWELSPAQFNLLNLLTDETGGLTQSDLSRELLTHRSNITGLVDRLEKRGLVRRCEEKGDRRAWRVVLVPKGRLLMEKILPDYYRAAETVWEGISQRRTDALVGTLKAIAVNVETAQRNLHSRFE